MANRAISKFSLFVANNRVASVFWFIVVCGWFLALRLWSADPAWWIWLAMGAGLTISRLVVTSPFRLVEQFSESSRWRVLHGVILLIGLHMSVLTFLTPLRDGTDLVFLLLFLVPSTIGSAFALGVSVSAFLLHTAPPMIALAFRLTGDRAMPDFIASAPDWSVWLSVTIYSVYTLVLCRTIGRTVDDYIETYNVLTTTRERVEQQAIELGLLAEDRAKAVEKAEVVSAAKSRLLANTSHEIRTPMNAILGMAQALRWNENDPKKAEKLDLLLQSGNDLKQLLSDIIDINQIEMGHLELHPVRSSCVDVLDPVFRLYRQLAEDKGLQFTIEKPDTLPSVCEFDPARLRQAVGNLLSNAIKYTDEGDIRVRFHVVRSDAEDITLAIDVTDTGIGLSEQDRSQVFERFDRSENELARARPGAGLGLAITRNLARLMGGELVVESELGRGSTFTLSWRGHNPDWTDADADQPSDPPIQTHDEAGDPLRILVAEDHPANREVIRLFLNAIGQDPKIVEDGQAAVELADGASFDVILLDIHMPRLNGIAALEHLRGRPGPNRETPVIMLSANLDPKTVAASHKAGACAHVSKPIAAEELFDAIERAVQKSV